MTTLTYLERLRLSDLAARIEAGDYTDDRMADTRTARAALWVVQHAGAILVGSIMLGAALSYVAILWFILQPW